MARHACARAWTCAAVAMAVFWPMAPAVAGTDPLPTAAWSPTAVRLSSDPGTAQVSGRYRCTGGTPTKDLWVSVKQGPGSDGLGEPGDRHPAAWYDQRDTEGKAGLSAVCDGAWHPNSVAVDSRLGVLKRGNAIVQWCIGDRTPYELNSQGFAFNCQAATVSAR